MDCRTCANYKPIEKPPFDGLKTDDLVPGMVVVNGARPGGFRFTILKPPDKEMVEVLQALEGYEPKTTAIYLADKGCQPYTSGKWNPINWLRKAK